MTKVLDTLLMLLAFGFVISFTVVGSVFYFGVRPLARGLEMLTLRLRIYKSKLAVLSH